VREARSAQNLSAGIQPGIPIKSVLAADLRQSAASAFFTAAAALIMFAAVLLSLIWFRRIA
jgi:hypothetical protein